MADYVVIVIGCEECGRPMRVVATAQDLWTAEDFERRVNQQRDPVLLGGVPANCATAVVLEMGALSIDTHPDTLTARSLLRESGHSPPSNLQPPSDGDPVSE